MNRRRFLQRLGVGLVGTAIAVGIKYETVATWAPESSKRWLTEYLIKEYHKRCKGVSSEARPDALVVGDDIYCQYRSELTPLTRYMADEPMIEVLAFKGMRMYNLGEPGKIRWLNRREHTKFVESLQV